MFEINDFKLIINDLLFDIGYVFVDDIATFSVSNDPHNCLLQKAADYRVLQWTNVNGIVIINTIAKLKKWLYISVSSCVLMAYH